LFVGPHGTDEAEQSIAHTFSENNTLKYNNLHTKKTKFLKSRFSKNGLRYGKIWRAKNAMNASRFFPILPDARDRQGQAGTPRCFEEEELKAIENRNRQ
jgi:hypothetical protein